MKTAALREPIVITAFGFSCPWGEGLAAFAAGAPVRSGAARRLPSYNVGERLPARGLRYASSVTQLFCSTALQALDSGSARPVLEQAPARVGIYHGADSPHLDDTFRFDLAAKLDGPESVSPMASPNTLPNAAVGELAIRLQVAGPSVTVACGPSSGVQALELACLQLGTGTVDYALAGSVELNTLYHQSLWDAAEDAANVPRCPELSVVVGLEPLRLAQTSGRSVLGRVLGTAGAALRDPACPERSALRALEAALDDAGLSFAELDLVLVAGAQPGFDSPSLAALAAELGSHAPVVALDPHAGQTENTGGLLAVAWSLALFQGQAEPSALWASESLGAGVAQRVRHIAVCSTDPFDNSSAIVLARAEGAS